MEVDGKSDKSEPQCSGPHADAFDCPVHGPALRRPAPAPSTREFSFTDARIAWIEAATAKGMPAPGRDELAAFADGYRAATASSTQSPTDVAVTLTTHALIGLLETAFRQQDYPGTAADVALLKKLIEDKPLLRVLGPVATSSAIEPIDLTLYVNAANISAADAPFAVVCKLQKAINDAAALPERKSPPMVDVTLPFGTKITMPAKEAEEKPKGRRLVYNKATRRIEVVRRDGLVEDSFEPPEELG